MVLTIYGRVAAGQQALAPGGYSAALSAGSQIAYTGGHDAAAPVKCADVGTRKLTPAFTMNVTATDQAACTLATSPVAFSSVQLLAVVRDATGAFSRNVD